MVEIYLCHKYSKGGGMNMADIRRKILQEGDSHLIYTIIVCVETGHRHDNCPDGDSAFYNELQLLNNLGENTPCNLYQCNCCGKIIG